MVTRDYLPKGDAQTIYWVNNFTAKLRSIGAILGVTDEERTQIEEDAIAVNDKLNSVQQLKQTYQSMVEAKNAAMETMRQRIRKMVNKIKLHDNYNATYAEDLGTVAPPPPTFPGGLDNAKPDFEITVLSDMNRLDWMKRIFDGVVIECKRGTEPAWTRLGTDYKSPFEDERQNLVFGVPETRCYRMRYLLDEKEIGQWSDEVKAICSIDSVT
jgi:hypothetical protein